MSRGSARRNEFLQEQTRRDFVVLSGEARPVLAEAKGYLVVRAAFMFRPIDGRTSLKTRFLFLQPFHKGRAAAKSKIALLLYWTTKVRGDEKSQLRVLS